MPTFLWLQTLWRYVNTWPCQAFVSYVRMWMVSRYTKRVCGGILQKKTEGNKIPSPLVQWHAALQTVNQATQEMFIWTHKLDIINKLCNLSLQSIIPFESSSLYSLPQTNQQYSGSCIQPPSKLISKLPSPKIRTTFLFSVILILLYGPLQIFS